MQDDLTRTTLHNPKAILIGAMAYMAMLLSVYFLIQGIGRDAEFSDGRALWPIPINLVGGRVAKTPDFASISDVTTGKRVFFDAMLPLVREQNAHILKLRGQVEALYRNFRLGMPLSSRAGKWLGGLAMAYRMDSVPDSDGAWRELLKRLDVIPASLVLAQAANESAWGTSYFARKANNYFGQWCFKPGCGLVPRRRTEGATHEVARFGNMAESVASYMRNLSSHPAFERLRDIRWAHRQEKAIVDGHGLAEGLEKYSGRGRDYVEDLQAMILHNQLAQFDLEAAP